MTDFRGTDHRPTPETIPIREIPYRKLLIEAGCKDVSQVSVPMQRTWTSQAIVGFLYSTYFAARERFGDRADEFEREIKRVLAQMSPDDTFIENEEFVTYLGRR